MMLKKNQIVPLNITGMTVEGNGVGKYDGMAVFVPLTAVGDTAQVKITKVLKNYAFGIIDSITSPSNDRIEGDCPVSAKCGGCSFRHISYESELKIKSDFIKDAFLRLAKIDIDFDEIIGASDINGYRNKAQYPVSEQDGQVVCGFYSRRSHRVIPHTDCKLQPSIFREIVDFIIEYCNSNGITGYDEEKGTGELRHIYIRQGFHTKEIMVCYVVNKPIKKELTQLSDKLSIAFPSIKSYIMNVNSKSTNVILGDKTTVLLQNDKIYDIMCNNKIMLSPHSFYQINTEQAERLYGIVAEYADLKGTETVLDLYCGAGTIGLSLSGKAKKIIGVEVIPQAIENAVKNAEINNISNAQFICGDAGMMAKKLSNDKLKPDVIVIDPPRKGCDTETIEAILKMSPQKIVMVSCNPATAARDARSLCDRGYEIKKARGVDLFPRTTHVESVYLFIKSC